MNHSVIKYETRGTGWLAQLLWFVFIGWWAGLLWTWTAWLFMATYIGIPVGVLMINMLPSVIALRGRRLVDSVTGQAPRQINLLIRALYFFVFGWWVSGIWLTIAYLLCLTIVLMPLGFKMFDLTPTVVSLRIQS